MILASTSTLYGSDFLVYLLPTLKVHFRGVKTLLFIPYARPGGVSFEAYTHIVRQAFNTISIAVKGIHEYKDPVEAILQAEAIYTGGGNTFVLLEKLYAEKLIAPLRKRILAGIPYLGTSAGSNIAGATIMTTNDMPIAHPPSYDALGIIDFNINPHYLEPEPESAHMGESRAIRIKEFHVYNDIPVIGLREGSWLAINGEDIQLKGNLTAKIFEQHKSPYEIAPETTLLLS